ncbi:MAG: RidA family protein [Bacteroidota bacterium]|nr:RidA family protein [Bacteroidota bacterium]
MTAEENLLRLQISLPPSPKPLGVYKPLLIHGNQVWLSGHGPLISEGVFILGRVGDTLTKEEGKQAARQVGLALLATLREQLGSLNRIKRVIKVLGMVSCTPEFDQHPFVINGCSELFAEIWGPDNGVGVRSAIGVQSLPGSIPVEIEAMFEWGEG